MRRRRTLAAQCKEEWIPSCALGRVLFFTIFLLCVAIHAVLQAKIGSLSESSLYRASTSSPIQDALQPVPDICRVAKAMSTKPLQFASYTGNGGLKPIGWPKHIPHVSSVICNRIITRGKPSSQQLEDATAQNGNALVPVKSIFSFKSARSGSTFFTSVVTDVLRYAGRPTTKYWEPSFCANLNKHSPGEYREAEYQAKSLRKLLTSKCQQTGGGCRPANQCKVPERADGDKNRKEPAYIVALNPRFLNQSIDWPSAVHGLGDTLRIFSLRRTNLILMAYSKFHHGGCSVDKALHDVDFYDRRMVEKSENNANGNVVANTGGRRPRRKGNFTFATMLKCIHHYTIGDQELSLSTAFAASAASQSNIDPYLILYEDVLSSGDVVQEGMLRHLGFTDASGDNKGDSSLANNNVFDNNGNTKLHSDPLCHYDDVDCDKLERGLNLTPKKKYPCLWKQYKRADEGLTWSMPLLPNGSVSLEGDCFPLEPLSKEKGARERIRNVDELYRFR